MEHLEPLMQQNFLDYASYVIVDRAIPDLRDGCKPVQRRILHTLFTMEDGKFHKVANVIGEAMKLHPHGDASIGEALVVLANKEYFIDKQGNFGNIITGHSAAAARYIECRLTELARETLFNPALTSYQMSYDGRRKEPEFLRAKVPVVLMLGTEGIAVGMATRILPHNFDELLAAQIRLLEGKSFKLYPDFAQGGIIDVNEYADGLGKVKVRALLEPLGDKKIIIRQIPFGTTTESLIASIESAIQKGKVKVGAISDYTTDRVEIELNLPRGTYADEVIPQLYAYTDCEVSISSNVVVINQRHPVEVGVSAILKHLTESLREIIKAEIEYELERLLDQQHWLTLEQIFIGKKVYKRIEAAKSLEGIRAEINKGMSPYAEAFLRPMTPEDVERLMDIKIRRISAYDLDKTTEDVQAIGRSIKTLRRKLKTLTETTIAYLQYLREKYGSRYPRKSKIQAFTSVDRKAIALQNIKLSYDPDTGFFGSEVKGSQHAVTVSEYDLLFALTRSGHYRIFSPPAKILLADLLVLELFSQQEGRGFTVIYKDTAGSAYAKKISITKFVRNKEYQLFGDRGGSIVHLLPLDSQATVRVVSSATARGQRYEQDFDMGDLQQTSVTARGTKLGEKFTHKITVLNA